MLGEKEGADGGGEEGYGGEPAAGLGQVGGGGADGGALAGEFVGVLEACQQGVGLGAEGVGLLRGASLRRELGSLGGSSWHAYGVVVVGEPRRFKVGM